MAAGSLADLGRVNFNGLARRRTAILPGAWTHQKADRNAGPKCLSRLFLRVQSQICLQSLDLPGSGFTRKRGAAYVPGGNNRILGRR